MMYFFSVADNHTGKFVGSILINKPSADAAAQAVHDIVGRDRCVEVAWCLVPVGAPPINPGFYGRLLTKEEVGQLGAGPAVAMYTDADGNFHRT